jgi:hypothetical protein
MTERTSELPPDEPDEAPEGFREQPRYAPTVERAYANDGIEVTWEPAFCINGGGPGSFRWRAGRAMVAGPAAIWSPS